VGYSNSIGIGLGVGNGASIYNNIIQNTNYWVTASMSITASDYNNFYNPNNCFQYLGNGYVGLSAWQTATGFDVHSVATNPNLSASYQPNSGSGVIGTAKNLYSI